MSAAVAVSSPSAASTTLPKISLTVAVTIVFALGCSEALSATAEIV